MQAIAPVLLPCSLGCNIALRSVVVSSLPRGTFVDENFEMLSGKHLKTILYLLIHVYKYLHVIVRSFNEEKCRELLSL